MPNYMSARKLLKHSDWQVEKWCIIENWTMTMSWFINKIAVSISFIAVLQILQLFATSAQTKASLIVILPIKLIQLICWIPSSLTCNYQFIIVQSKKKKKKKNYMKATSNLVVNLSLSKAPIVSSYVFMSFCKFLMLVIVLCFFFS